MIFSIMSSIFPPKVLTTDLEKALAFGEFSDFCNTFELQRGKTDEDESSTVGEFKVSQRVKVVLRNSQRGQGRSL